MIDWARLAQHLPQGMFAAWVMFGFPVPFLARPEPALMWVIAGVAALLVFIIRQVVQDWRELDKCWKDVLGIVWGFAVVTGSLGIVWRLL